MTNPAPDNGIGKKCKKCDLSVSEGAIFRIHKKNGEQSICRSCEAEIAKDYRKKNPTQTAKHKKNYRTKHYGTIKHHVQEKIATWRKASNVPSDLTVEYLISLYEMQDGYCFYSGEKMIFGWVNGKVHHNSLSLDKLDPTKGYVIGNVVWCTYLINTMKQNMNERQFYDTINSVLNTTYGVSMIELSIADKLRKLTTQAKLGELPKVIERMCAEEASQGKSSCKIYFYENGKVPFYGSMGVANKAIYSQINNPFERERVIGEREFLEQNIRDLITETSLNVRLILPTWFTPNNQPQEKESLESYRFGASVVLELSW